MFQYLKTLTLALILSIGFSYAYAAWAPPTQTPPFGNVDAPVNVGSATQLKAGALGITGLLDVVGNLAVRSSGTITSDTEIAHFSAPGSLAGVGYTSFGGGFVGWDYANNGIALNAHSAGGSVGGIFVQRINNGASNVGIGTVSPTEKLDVAGNIKTGDDRNVSALMIGNWGHKIGREPSDGSLYIGGGQANIILQNNVGIGTASLAPWEKLKVNGAISISGADPDGLASVTSESSGLPLRLKSRAGNYPDLVVNTNGNVGIGTVSPGVGLKLGVAGNVGADKYCNRDGNACITNTGTGIQFPDGTTQSTAFTGGGGGVSAKYYYDLQAVSDTQTSWCSTTWTATCPSNYILVGVGGDVGDNIDNTAIRFRGPSFSGRYVSDDGNIGSSIPYQATIRQCDFIRRGFGHTLTAYCLGPTPW